MLDAVWRFLLRPILFRLPPERSHRLTMRLFSLLMKVPGCRRLTTAFFRVNDPCLRVRRFGIEFQNPVGLAAGFDKDAKWVDSLQVLGFGFIEVGTLTAKLQQGNPEPRVFRLPADEALLNRMGSPNQGAAAAAIRLEGQPIRGVLGINIGKTASVPNESAPADYLTSFECLYPFASYFVLNVSSPNTPGLRKLQAREYLEPILKALMDRNETIVRFQKEQRKPILVKVSPDMDDAQRDDLVDLCIELRLDGIVVANTTTSREGLTTKSLQELGDGGISGGPLTERARALVAAVYRRTRGRLPIIGVGGIMTEEDAWQMIRAGASLVQVYSGLVYRGPGFVAAINRHLARRLAECGKASIEDVIGEASVSSPFLERVAS